MGYSAGTNIRALSGDTLWRFPRRSKNCTVLINFWEIEAGIYHTKERTHKSPVSNESNMTVQRTLENEVWLAQHRGVCSKRKFLLVTISHLITSLINVLSLHSVVLRFPLSMNDWSKPPCSHIQDCKT
jgi:hypothetical protein